MAGAANRPTGGLRMDLIAAGYAPDSGKAIAFLPRQHGVYARRSAMLAPHG